MSNLHDTKRKITGYRVTEYLRIASTKLTSGYYTTWKRYTYKYYVQAFAVRLILRSFSLIEGIESRRVDSKIETLFEPIKLDYSQIEDVDVDGIHGWDAPDFCDAYICSATYKGRDMTDEELDALNDDRDFVYTAVERKLY